MLQIAHYLDLVTPALNPHLVAPAFNDELRQVAAAFPSRWTRCFGFECRLDIPTSSADFLFCVTRRERDGLGGGALLRQLEPPLAGHPLWRRFDRFAQAWADPASDLYHNVLMLWFEFDLPGAVNSLVSPGFFFGSREIPPKGGGESRWIFDTALSILLDERPQPRLEAAVRRCIRLLPEGAHLYQIGLFPGRPGTPVRCCLTGIRPAEITPFLRELGLPFRPEQFAEIDRLVAGLAPLAELHLDIDLIDDFLPKIGVECSQDRDTFIGLVEKDARLLEHLRGLGVCDDDRLAALLAYSGYFDARKPPAEWLALRDLTGADPAADPGAIYTHRRDLGHVKVVYQEGKPMQAKAYVGVIHDTLPPLSAARHALSYQVRDRATRSLQQTLFHPGGDQAAG